MAAFGLYTHIRANRIRSMFLIGGLFLLVYVLVFAGSLAGEALADNAPFNVLLQRALVNMIPAIPVATLVALAWIAIAYFFNRRIISAVTGSYDVTRTEEPALYALLENLCISRGLTVPRLSIMETDALNAYASGMSEGQYAVTVTRGLMETLSRDELEAVLAHELTHIRNKDVQLMVTAVIIAGVISFFGELIFRWMQFTPRRSSQSSSKDKGNGGAAIAFMVALGLVVLAWVLSIVIRFSLSRSREYLADAGAVELTKNPDAMIGALMKISGHSDLPSAPSSVMEMCVDNPRHGFASLLSTHPPIEKRIEALVRHGGGRAPTTSPPSAPFSNSGHDAPVDDTAGTNQVGPWGSANAGPTSTQPGRKGPWG
ncbi:M48 family metallopeptidase [Pseudochelatococcus sp. G4_1912]|jgi:heat shock protein HtpX|uniref:M48 family metallopeptidase n=1 Tax=Pseudochelatococcus sp. G4_1912 TaxID=3114288 RepID=UPI0039C723AA